MNAADLARLEVAKRAYRAVEPSAAEVQRGVRKARLSLRRPRQRRAWFSKTLVAVVLAMGGLAYAKPQALGEWVENALQAGRGLSPKHAGGSAAPAPAALTPQVVGPEGAAVNPSPAAATPLVEATEPAPGSRRPTPASQSAAVTAFDPTSAAKAAIAKAPIANASTAKAPPARDASSDSAEAMEANATTSKWGRVGDALAHGDESRALTALEDLGQNADPRTRDKADLGRAQLLLAGGDLERGCALARSLTNRRAGGRIERQALALLKSCAP